MRYLWPWPWAVAAAVAVAVAVAVRGDGPEGTEDAIVQILLIIPGRD